MKSIKVLTFFNVIIFLINCSTPYQPKGALGGYSSIKTGGNTYRVEFKGNQHTKANHVYEYLERRCAEITIENGYDYFIVYEDSSYVDENKNKDAPGIDALIEGKRSDKYLLTTQQPVEENPIQTYIGDRNTKIARTFGSSDPVYGTNTYSSFIEDNITNVNGVFKILLTNEIIEKYKEYYHPAEEILKKYLE